MFTSLLTHTSLTYEGILSRTRPQIEAIMTSLGKHVCLKAGVPYEEKPLEGMEEHTTDDALAFCAHLNGLY